jgi:hypothetical protein
MPWLPEAKSNLRNIETGLLGMSRPEWNQLISYTEATITLLDDHSKAHAEVPLHLLDAKLPQMKAQLECLYTTILRRDQDAALSQVRSTLELVSQPGLTPSDPLSKEAVS